MDPARQRQIAALGGKRAHACGKAHQFSPEEARVAGRKGGQAPRRKPHGLEVLTEPAAPLTAPAIPPPEEPSRSGPGSLTV
jgi:general stress protein YciG